MAGSAASRTTCSEVGPVPTGRRDRDGDRCPAGGNRPYSLGNQKLVFDPERETFIGNDEANSHLKPPYGQKYRIPDEV